MLVDDVALLENGDHDAPTRRLQGYATAAERLFGATATWFPTSPAVRARLHACLEQAGSIPDLADRDCASAVDIARHYQVSQI